MKIAILDTYYPAFLASHYAAEPDLESRSYSEQLRSLLDACFGTSDYYSRHLKALGCEAVDIIANCAELQASWADENSHAYTGALLKIPTRLQRLPLIGGLIAALPGVSDLAVAQIRALQPEVLYCQDSALSPRALATVRDHVKLIVGQIAIPFRRIASRATT
jgi:hypothetical protein